MTHDPHPYYQQPTIVQPYSGPPAAASPGVMYGGQLPAGDQPDRGLRFLIIGVAALTVVAVGAAAWVAPVVYEATDSGIRACKAMRDGKNFSGGPQSTTGLDGLPEQRYRELRDIFANSRYDNIREHGTKLIDLAWQLSKSDKDAGLEMLAYVGPVMEHSTGLQSACADHGIIVDLRKGK